MFNTVRLTKQLRCNIARNYTRTVSNSNDLSSYGNVLGGDSIKPEALSTFQTWHECVTNAIHNGGGDKDKLEKKLRLVVHNDVLFYPPTYYNHWKGRDEFLVLISSVSEVFGKSFTYHRQWLSSDGLEWALEFSTRIGNSNKTIDGIDLVKLNSKGEIVEFKVLARPPNGVHELKNAMMLKAGPRLALLKAKQSLPF